ncbi:hypothetical protein [uncultured Bartonella sp.]|uniref:hypothetical protein n=1 Tax=uncultured Bartonella sp. TaxID=104108 RepID=UPI0025F71012|nr:hypothetical protein [uncultured Bartonella sp.]
MKVEAKRITTASRWQQTGTIKRTAKDLKYEMAFLSRAFSSSAHLLFLKRIRLSNLNTCSLSLKNKCLTKARVSYFKKRQAVRVVSSASIQ